MPLSRRCPARVDELRHELGHVRADRERDVVGRLAGDDRLALRPARAVGRRECDALAGAGLLEPRGERVVGGLRGREADQVDGLAAAADRRRWRRAAGEARAAATASAAAAARGRRGALRIRVSSDVALLRCDRGKLSRCFPLSGRDIPDRLEELLAPTRRSSQRTACRWSRCAAPGSPARPGRTAAERDDRGARPKAGAVTGGVGDRAGHDRAEDGAEVAGHLEHRDDGAPRPPTTSPRTAPGATESAAPANASSTIATIRPASESTPAAARNRPRPARGRRDHRPPSARVGDVPNGSSRAPLTRLTTRKAA